MIIFFFKFEALPNSFPERLNHFAFLPATQEGSNGIPLCSYIHVPNDPEHLFIYFLVTGLSFLQKYLFKSFTYFSKLNCWSFCCLTSHSPEKLETKALPFLPVTFQWKGFQVLEKDTPGLQEIHTSQRDRGRICNCEGFFFLSLSFKQTLSVKEDEGLMSDVGWN